jgi:hypothetical protein
MSDAKSHDVSSEQLQRYLAVAQKLASEAGERTKGGTYTLRVKTSIHESSEQSISRHPAYITHDANNPRQYTQAKSLKPDFTGQSK